jgi:hypothetical protein
MLGMMSLQIKEHKPLAGPSGEAVITNNLAQRRGFVAGARAARSATGAGELLGHQVLNLLWG